MTFLQLTLGRNYKWWYVIKYYFKLEGAYFWSNIFHFFGQSISILSAVLIWSFSTSDKNILLNLLIGIVVYALSSNTVYWFVGESIRNGRISNVLILPVGIIKFYCLFSLGVLFRIIIYYFIIFIPIFVLFGNVLNLNNVTAINLIFTSIMILVAFLIRYLIAYCIGSSAFWTVQVYGQANFYENLLPLFAGIIFPYNLIPFIQLKNILISSPWAFIVYHPTQIFLGKYSPIEISQTFGGGIIWCLVLWIMARLVFKAGLKKNEAVGL
jgi:ABC-2 type transport system permease protein